MDDHERRMSIGSSQSRPDVENPSVKRQRIDTKNEDKVRGKRLFGNLLGTLQKFKNDDKTSRTSEAAKRREQVASRIAAKLRSETTLHHEIAEAERELKSLRIATESAEFVLKHKTAATSARHASLRPISKFLHTTKPTPSPLIFETKLINPSPIPLAHGPSREPQIGQLKPLYFLPKILLPEQEDELNLRIANLEEMMGEESSALEKEKSDTAAMGVANRARITELVAKLDNLRSQLKPIEKIEGAREAEDIDREEGIQIQGEDGDVEVEY